MDQSMIGLPTLRERNFEMREARPDDPIFKTGFVIGEKRQRTSPQDMTGQRESRDKQPRPEPRPGKPFRVADLDDEEFKQLYDALM